VSIVYPAAQLQDIGCLYCHWWKTRCILRKYQHSFLRISAKVLVVATWQSSAAPQWNCSPVKKTLLKRARCIVRWKTSQISAPSPFMLINKTYMLASTLEVHSGFITRNERSVSSSTGGFLLSLVDAHLLEAPLRVIKESQSLVRNRAW
jgi:hypothetical protein